MAVRSSPVRPPVTTCPSSRTTLTTSSASTGPPPGSPPRPLTHIADALPERTPEWLRNLGSDPAIQRPAESPLVAAKRTLAGGASLADILTSLCAAIDAQNPDMTSMVMLMDPDGQRMWPVGGPRVRADFAQAFTPFMIGPNMGCCGTAAFRKERVIISDIASDPLWSGLRDGQSREVALAHGFHAAWSQPLLSKGNEVLGTFGLLHGTPRSPTGRELQLIEDAATIAVIAIEGERSRAALQKALVEITRSEDCLRTILDTIPTQAWCLRADGSVAYLNQRWHEYTGLSRDEVWKGEPRREPTERDVRQLVVHPDDAPSIAANRQHEILPAAKASEYELRQRRYDGEYRWFMVRVEPLLDDWGNVVRWYGTNTDIEDLKRAEEKLRQDEQVLRGIVDAISQSIVVLSPDGTHHGRANDPGLPGLPDLLASRGLGSAAG